MRICLIPLLNDCDRAQEVDGVVVIDVGRTGVFVRLFCVVFLCPLFQRMHGYL